MFITTLNTSLDIKQLNQHGERGKKFSFLLLEQLHFFLMILDHPGSQQTTISYSETLIVVEEPTKSMWIVGERTKYRRPYGRCLLVSQAQLQSGNGRIGITDRYKMKYWRLHGATFWPGRCLSVSQASQQSGNGCIGITVLQKTKYWRSYEATISSGRCLLVYQAQLQLGNGRIGITGRWKSKYWRPYGATTSSGRCLLVSQSGKCCIGLIVWQFVDVVEGLDSLVFIQVSSSRFLSVAISFGYPFKGDRSLGKDFHVTPRTGIQ